MNNNVKIFFPEDKRDEYARNDLLDGRFHNISIRNMTSFWVGSQNFYNVEGYDNTRNCEVNIILINEMGHLKKVPLYDYDELNHLNIDEFPLKDNMIQDIIKSTGGVIESMPITSLAKIVQKKSEVDKNNNKIVVFEDLEGRDFILASAAKVLGFPDPKTVNYLPLKFYGEIAKGEFINNNMGFRLLNEKERDWIRENFICKYIGINNLNVIEYECNYYINRPCYESNFEILAHKFYNFGKGFEDCVLINKTQKDFIDRYYTTNYQIKYNLNDKGQESANEKIISKKENISRNETESGIIFKQKNSEKLQDMMLSNKYDSKFLAFTFSTLAMLINDNDDNALAIILGNISKNLEIDTDDLIKEAINCAKNLNTDNSIAKWLVSSNADLIEQKIYGNVKGEHICNISEEQTNGPKM